MYLQADTPSRFKPEGLARLISLIRVQVPNYVQYLPKTIITIPNMETLNTLLVRYFGPLLGMIGDCGPKVHNVIVQSIADPRLDVPTDIYTYMN